MTTTAQMPDSDAEAVQRRTLARIVPHLLAVGEAETCARIHGELPALEEAAQVLESVALIAHDAAEADPLSRNKLLASLKLAKEANDAHTAVSQSKAAWAAAAIEAIEATPSVLIIPSGD